MFQSVSDILTKKTQKEKNIQKNKHLSNTF